MLNYQVLTNLTGYGINMEYPYKIIYEYFLVFLMGYDDMDIHMIDMYGILWDTCKRDQNVESPHMMDIYGQVVIMGYEEEHGIHANRPIGK